ncbi:tyrosine-type recombinase/integrase [Planctomycetota bacterium]
MASVSKDKRGNRKVQYVDQDKRRTIYLGKEYNDRKANSFKVKLEGLLASRVTGPDEELLRWVDSLPDKIHTKLAKLDLVKARTSHTVESYVDKYIKARKVKPTTVSTWKQTKRVLIDFFGEGRDLRSITPGMATRFREYLDELGLAEATSRKRVSIAKQMFKKAMSEGFIRENPFSHLVCAAVANSDRFFFMDADLTAQVMDAMPHAQWRVIFALARYGGIRVPSELLPLKGTDINWHAGMVLITSPKTEHHPGGDTRLIPLFPELRAVLLEAFDQAKAGAEYVIADRKANTSNLRTQFTRLLNNAGIPVWPKLFQNLRSSRETELVEEYPIHVVCAWLGNSPAIASKHYLQTHKDYFRKAAHIPAQSVHAEGCNDSQESGGQSTEGTTNTEFCHVLRDVAKIGENPNSMPYWTHFDNLSASSNKFTT